LLRLLFDDAAPASTVMGITNNEIAPCGAISTSNPVAGPAPVLPGFAHGVAKYLSPKGFQPKPPPSTEGCEVYLWNTGA
jgi:hypothetical protein